MISDRRRRAALCALIGAGGILLAGCVDRTPGVHVRLGIEVVPATSTDPTLELLDGRLNLARVTLEPCPETVAWTPWPLTGWLVGRAQAHGGAHAEGEDGDIVVELHRQVDLLASGASISTVVPIPPHHPICAVWLTPAEPVGAQIRTQMPGGEARAWALFLRPQRIPVEPLSADADDPIAPVTLRVDGQQWLAPLGAAVDEAATRDALTLAFAGAISAEVPERGQ